MRRGETLLPPGGATTRRSMSLRFGVALSAAIAPYAGRLAGEDWREDPGLVRGINVEGGKITHPALMS